MIHKKPVMIHFFISDDSYDTVMDDWYVPMGKKADAWQELRFGLFIHFGLYSIPGGVWKGTPVRNGYSEQIFSHGPVEMGEYEALADAFKPDSFDAPLIARTAKNAGMRYVVITTKHHDGFCLFQTKTTSYNSYEKAAGRDFIAELSQACRLEGLGFGIYFSLIDWNFPEALPFSDHNSDEIPEAHHQLNMAQVEELLTKYGPIRELWFDMGKPSREQSRELADLVRRLQPMTMMSGRIWNNQEDFLLMEDNEVPDFPLHRPWQTASSIFRETWGYRSWQERGDVRDKAREHIRKLATVSARGGNYLLNIGPKGDGSLVPFEVELLQLMGEWMKGNQEVIRAQSAGARTGEEWGFVSWNSHALYLQVHHCPSNGILRFKGVGQKPLSAYLLDTPSQIIPVTQEGEDLVVNVQSLSSDDFLPVVKIVFAQPLTVEMEPLEVNGSGLINQLGEERRHFQGGDYYNYVHGVQKRCWNLKSTESGSLEIRIPCVAGQHFHLETQFPEVQGEEVTFLPEGKGLDVCIRS